MQFLKIKCEVQKVCYSGKLGFVCLVVVCRNSRFHFHFLFFYLNWILENKKNYKITSTLKTATKVSIV